MNLTKQYPFGNMAIGDSFTVTERFQHARVAASEYGAKNRMCFTCRMDAEIPGQARTMRVWRVEMSQVRVDQRGRNAKRRIPVNTARKTLDVPTEREFVNWLDTLTPGQSHAMPAQYQAQYVDMMRWTHAHSSNSGKLISAGLWHDGTLMLQRII